MGSSFCVEARSWTDPEYSHATKKNAWYIFFLRASLTSVFLERGGKWDWFENEADARGSALGRAGEGLRVSLLSKDATYYAFSHEPLPRSSLSTSQTTSPLPTHTELLHRISLSPRTDICDGREKIKIKLKMKQDVFSVSSYSRKAWK